MPAEEPWPIRSSSSPEPQRYRPPSSLHCPAMRGDRRRQRARPRPRSRPHPAVVVGDLDSISPEGLAWAARHAVDRAAPVDKAATDTELAVDHAIARRPQRLVLVGAGDGTRLDHAITTIGVLGRPELAGLSWRDGGGRHVWPSSTAGISVRLRPPRHRVLGARPPWRGPWRLGHRCPLATRRGHLPTAVRMGRQQREPPSARSPSAVAEGVLTDRDPEGTIMNESAHLARCRRCADRRELRRCDAAPSTTRRRARREDDDAR